MTKLERELKRREERRINSLNKVETDLAEDALKVLWDLVLVLIGIVLGVYLTESRVQAATSVSIPPRCEYVGVMLTEPQTGAQPPTGVNESHVAAMPDAEMVEPVGERWESLGVWKCTAYCKGSCCNGRNAGRTASGAPMVVGRTVAVGHLPFGTVLKIGGHEYVVEDRGVRGNHVDILFNSHGGANQFGVQYMEVMIKR